MIGTHSVTLLPDPDVYEWGPDLASNPEFTANAAGWTVRPFEAPWVWAAGWVETPDTWTGNGPSLARAATAPIPRTATATYRVRARVRVDRDCWAVLSLRFGVTALVASEGAFWHPDDCLEHAQWFSCPTAGTYTFDLLVNGLEPDPTLTYLGPAVIAVTASGPPVRLDVDYCHLQGQGADAVDVSCLVDQVSIRHGRTDTTGQPDASSCTLDLSADTGTDDLSAALEVGAIIRVETTIASGASTRFVGRVTDVAVGWDDAGEDTPNRPVAQVIATSVLADLGRRVVGDTPYPQELDGARVAAVCAAAGFPLDPLTSDPGTVQLIARDIDSQPAADVARAAGESAGGILWDTRTGDVRYADAEHRRGTVPALTLDACLIEVSPVWSRTSDGLVNAVTIGYGPPPESGDQPAWSGERADSIAAYGRYEYSFTSELAAADDAQRMGTLLLTRNRRPAWILGSLPVAVADLDAEQTAALLSLEVHDLLTVEGLPAAGSVPTTATLWVEGWSETLAYGVHEWDAVVSGYCRTSPPPRWNDLPPEWTWDTVTPPDLTWDDATCFGPQETRGRWDDVPASTRWDQVPAGTTWNTWED